jgi:hypothetical protein
MNPYIKLSETSQPFISLKQETLVFRKRVRKYHRKIKIRKILGLPHKNEYISPGVYTREFD